MEKITMLLKQTRESKGLSLKDVEAATRVPRSYLEALEGGGDNRLLTDRLYLVPFLRTYAAFLGIDQAIAVTLFLNELYRETKRPIQPERLPASSRLSFWAVPFLLLFGLLGVLSVVWQQGGYETIHSWWQSWRGKNEFSAKSESAPLSPSSPSGLLPAAETSSTPSVSSPETVPSPPAATSSLSDATTQGTSPAPASPPAVAAPPPSESLPVVAATSQPASPSDSVAHHLRIQAKETTWVRVAVDGQRPKDLFLHPGETREWPAQKGFILSLGNAGGVTLNLDGQELPPAGKPGQVVRNLRLPAAE